MNLDRSLLKRLPFAERVEIEENLLRKDLTQSETYAIQERLREILAEQRSKGAPRGNRNAAKNKVGQMSPVVPDREGKRTDALVGKMFGESGKTVQRRRDVMKAAKADPEEFGDLVEEMNRTGRVGGVHRKLKIAKQVERITESSPQVPTGPFRVIVADPPWEYTKRADDSTQRGRTPYPSMSKSAIASLPVGDLAHDDCILWLWTTNAHLPLAFDVADGWGFTYKTLLTWAKERMGTGDWLRGQTEHCLLCVRGKPVTNLSNQTTLLRAPVRAHSRKPDEFYELVEALCPGSKVELFARLERQGWAAHGDELGDFRADRM